MRPEEKVIQEKRTILATKNDLMGAEGKLGLIARFLGEPMIRQGSGFHDETYLDDPYDIDEDEILTADEGEAVYFEGYVFSGLKWGMHMEIHLHEDESKIIVWYKGYEVYREEAGDLLGYAPFPEWENMIERIYKIAKKKEQESKNDFVGEIEKEIQKEKKSFFEKLRLKWGFGENDYEGDK